MASWFVRPLNVQTPNNGRPGSGQSDAPATQKFQTEASIQSKNVKSSPRLNLQGGSVPEPHS
jgi:hypothetical protein